MLTTKTEQGYEIRDRLDRGDVFKMHYIGFSKSVAQYRFKQHFDALNRQDELAKGRHTRMFRKEA